MFNSQFWVIFKKRINASNVLPNTKRSGSDLPAVCILELTSDGLVYLWAREPEFHGLCMVCKNLQAKSSAVCNSDVPAGYPCHFQAVPEAILSQDFDDFLVDGEYFAECGYFYSFEDFKRQNGLSETDFFWYSLGYFPSIRGARKTLSEVTSLHMA